MRTKANLAAALRKLAQEREDILAFGRGNRLARSVGEKLLGMVGDSFDALEATLSSEVQTLREAATRLDEPDS